MPFSCFANISSLANWRFFLKFASTSRILVVRKPFHTKRIAKPITTTAPMTPSKNPITLNPTWPSSPFCTHTKSSQYCPEYCPYGITWHLHLPHSHVPWPEHKGLKNRPHGVMQVLFELLQSHEMYPGLSPHPEIQTQFSHWQTPP